MSLKEFVEVREADYVTWGESMSNAMVLAHRDYVTERIEESHLNMRRLVAEGMATSDALAVVVTPESIKWCCTVCNKPVMFDRHQHVFVDDTGSYDCDGPLGHRPIKVEGTT
jgi:hypothetical protein